MKLGQITVFYVVLITFYRSQDYQQYIDCGNVIYNEACSKSFHKKSESVHYDSCLALAGVVKEKILRKSRYDIKDFYSTSKADIENFVNFMRFLREKSMNFFSVIRVALS